VRARAKVTIDSLYEKSIGTKINDLDLCLEVVTRSYQPLRYIHRWISRKPLEKRLGSKGPPMAYGKSNSHVTVTDDDPERSRSWPQYA